MAEVPEPYPPLPYPTHALREAQLSGDRPTGGGGVLTVHHALASVYAWDAGVAIGGFLEGLKAGKILGRRCESCLRVLVPPRMFCEECFRATSSWVELPDAGTVASFSVCHVAWDLKPLEVPQIPAVIELGGIAGRGILHMLGGVDPLSVSVNMQVQAAWRPAADRTGSVLDIMHWCPVGHV